MINDVQKKSQIFSKFHQQMYSTTYFNELKWNEMKSRTNHEMTHGLSLKIELIPKMCMNNWTKNEILSTFNNNYDRERELNERKIKTKSSFAVLLITSAAFIFLFFFVCTKLAKVACSLFSVLCVTSFSVLYIYCQLRFILDAFGSMLMLIAKMKWDRTKQKMKMKEKT